MNMEYNIISMKNDNIIKRTELYRSYRNEILKDALAIDNSRTANSKRINKLIQQVIAVDRNILLDLEDFAIDIAECFIVNKKTDIDYSNLNLNDIPIDIKTLDSLEFDIQNSNKNLAYYYHLENGEINSDIVYDRVNKQKLLDIKEKLDNVKTKVENFPKESEVNLSKLNKLIETVKAKQKKNEVFFKFAKLQTNNKYKIFYFATIGVFSLLLLITIILTIIYLTI